MSVTKRERERLRRRRAGLERDLAALRLVHVEELLPTPEGVAKLEAFVESCRPEDEGVTWWSLEDDGPRLHDLVRRVLKE